MAEHSQDLTLKLAQSRQDLEHARARVAELEAALAIDFKPPAGPGPSNDPSLQPLVVYPREPAGHSLAGFAKLAHDLPHHQQAEVQGFKLNRTLGLLRDLNQAIVRVRHLPSLFATACTRAVESGAFCMAWIGLFDAETRHMKAVAQAGMLAGDLEKLAPNFWGEPVASPPQTQQWQPGARWVCNDIENEPQMAPWRADALRLGYRAAVALPLVIAGEVGGSFNLYAAEPDFFDEQQLDLLEKMAADLSFAMTFAAQEEQRHQAEAAIKRYAQRMEILHNIDRGIIGATSMQAVVEVALCHIRQLIPCQRASVILFDWATQEWIVFADDAGQPSSIPKAVRHKISPGWDEGFGTAQTRIIDDLRTIPPTPVYQQLIKDGLVAGIQARVVVQGQLLGLLGLNADTPGFFTAEYQEIATEVANQLAIAIRQMHLSEAITLHTAELERHVVEIQRTHEVLHRSESLFRAIFEQVAVGIARCALDGRCLQVNQRFSEIVGYTLEELSDKTYQALTHPADMPADLAGMRQLLQGEIPFYATQKRYFHRRGHVVWVNLTVSLVRDAQGAPDYCVAMVEEITQLKQVEQALLQSENRYRRVVEDQLDLIGRFQADYKLTFVNRAYCEALGKRPDELI
ncbi:MAG: PAS domain S-box protein, partial [Chloroflexi bacterium]|nr:PAS domain S-box protein [Chloroflexota bacterium]